MPNQTNPDNDWRDFAEITRKERGNYRSFAFIGTTNESAYTSVDRPIGPANTFERLHNPLHCLSLNTSNLRRGLKHVIRFIQPIIDHTRRFCGQRMK